MIPFVFPQIYMFMSLLFQISDHKELTKARGWKLIDMQIANNPMTARLKESNAYPKYESEWMCPLAFPG